MQDFTENEYWRVVYVASRQEKKVALKMEQLGIAFYLPVSKRLRIWSDRKKWVDFPMFNGYLFVRPKSHQTEIVVQTQGVVNYLSFEKKHARVSEKEIEIIRKIEESGYYAEGVLTPDDFEEGEEMLVTAGPLKGQTVTLIRKNNETQFLVSFEGLGHSIKVALPLEVLAKKEPA